MATPFNFLEQSGKLWQAWSEQQQNILKAMAGSKNIATRMSSSGML